MTTTKATMKKTGFDRLVGEFSQDKEWAAGYERERAHLIATESILRNIDQARRDKDLSKAELARRIGAEPSVVRRLLSQQVANPTLSRVIDLAAAVGLKVTLTSARRG